MRWGAPFFDDDEGDHGDGCPCLRCEAPRFLWPEDFSVVELYRLVRDQLVNLTPMGTKDGKFWMAPRIEAWYAVAERFGYTNDDVECARFLHAAVGDRISREEWSAALAPPPDELMPPTADWTPDV